MALAKISLTTAVSKTEQRWTVSSTTGMTAAVQTVGGPSFVFIDDEICQVMSVVSSTVITVQRAMNGSNPTVHGAGRAITWGPAADFQQVGPFFNLGASNSHNFAGPVFFDTAPVTSTTAGAVTYGPGQILNTLILRDPAGASRTDVLPTAALLVAALPFPMIGTSFFFTIRNDADAAETITVSAGTGGTVTGGGTMTIAQSNMKTFLVRITATTPGAEAYIVYSFGTVVF